MNTWRKQAQYRWFPQGGGGGGGGSALFFGITRTNGSTTYPAIIGSIDGINTLFTVPEGKYAAGKLLVFYNGNFESHWLQTNPATGEFTMQFVPIVGDQLFVQYSKT